MSPSEPQTLSTTTLFDIRGDPVLRVQGPVTGSISLGYDCLHPPATRNPVWFLHVHLAPTIPDTATTDTAHATVLSLPDTRVYAGSAYLWLTPGRRPPRNGTNPSQTTPHPLVTDPWAHTMTPLPATAAAALHALYVLILTDWHTPQRLHNAQLAHPPPDTTRVRLATIHTLRSPPP
ncbi:hypothetical protein OG225_42140 (plasmid) [Nocardia sp. NBC_01377]|uniref:hypothetical protein n=1 Tax=Nocardia sp. NBC_01377 TaxID=2903595 RepID=UPI002F919D6A